MASGKLTAATQLNTSDVYIVAVPTPVDSIKQPDLTVYESVDLIIPVLRSSQTIIIESTIPVGTTKKVLDYIKEKKPALFNSDGEPNFALAYCPERILPVATSFRTKHK